MFSPGTQETKLFRQNHTNPKPWTREPGAGKLAERWHFFRMFLLVDLVAFRIYQLSIAGPVVAEHFRFPGLGLKGNGPTEVE